MFWKKIGITFTVILIVLVFFANNAFAMSIEELGPIYTEESSRVAGFGKELFGIIKNIAVISAVVVLAFIGLKFMFGSVDQKAEYKKSLIPLAIGMFVVLGATTITGLVWDFQGIGSESCSHRVSCNTSTCVYCGKTVAFQGHSYKLDHVRVEEDVFDDGTWTYTYYYSVYRCENCGDEYEEYSNYTRK